MLEFPDATADEDLLDLLAADVAPQWFPRENA
jgi:hypothetical protein